MDALADAIIDFFTRFKTDTPSGQWAVLLSIIGIVFGPSLAIYGWSRRRIQSLVGEEERLSLQLAEHKAKLASIGAERDKVAALAPGTVGKRIQTELADGNHSKAVDLAQDYLERQTFGRACALLANHYIARFEDGAEALGLARACAMGAIAAAPGDRDGELLLDEIDAMERIAAAPEETQEESRRKAERDRLRALLRDNPEDVDALMAVARQEVDAGRYRTAIAIYERADLVASDGPDGPDGRAALTARFWLGLATLRAGRTKSAREIVPLVVRACEKSLGAEDPLSLSARWCEGELLMAEGWSAEAEDLFRALLPDMEKAQGPEHPDTLAARHALAYAVLDQGRAAEAEDLFRALLRDMEEAKGPEHPDTLTTRRSLCRAALETGSRARAEAALAPVAEDGGDPDPRRQGQTALLRAWLADLAGDAARAGVLLTEAEGHLADLTPEHFARRQLTRYRETRVPGGTGGTTIWAGPQGSQPNDSGPDHAGGREA